MTYSWSLPFKSLFCAMVGLRYAALSSDMGISIDPSRALRTADNIFSAIYHHRYHADLHIRNASIEVLNANEREWGYLYQYSIRGHRQFYNVIRSILISNTLRLRLFIKRSIARGIKSGSDSLFSKR